MEDILTNPAAPSPATEVAPSPAPAESSKPAYDMDALGKDERQALIAKGQLPKRIPKDTAKPAESPTATSEAKAKTEPDSEPGDEDLEKLTPEQRKASNRNWRETALKAKDDIIENLKSQLAAKQTSAPAAPKVDPVEPPKPAAEIVIPDLDDYLQAGKTTKQWQLDYAKAIEDRAIRRAEASVEARFSKAELQNKTEKANQTWAEQKKAAQGKYADYDKVTDALKVTPVMNDEILARTDGAEISYWLGLPENAKELAAFQAATNIDGLAYKDLAEAARKNPNVRDRILVARGYIQAELNRIAIRLANPPAKPVTEKITTTAPKPPRPAAASTAPVADELRSAVEEKRWDDVNRIRARQKMERRGFGTK